MKDLFPTWTCMSGIIASPEDTTSLPIILIHHRSIFQGTNHMQVATFSTSSNRNEKKIGSFGRLIGLGSGSASRDLGINPFNNSAIPFLLLDVLVYIPYLCLHRFEKKDRKVPLSRNCIYIKFQTCVSAIWYTSFVKNLLQRQTANIAVFKLVSCELNLKLPFPKFISFVKLFNF